MNIPKPPSNLPTSCDCSRSAAQSGRPTFARRYADFWRVTAVLLCLGLMAAQSATEPPMPPVKKKVQALHSPRGQEFYLATPMAIVLPERSFALHWSYRLPLPRPGVMFTVERQRDFQSPWVKVGSTSAPPFAITTELPKAFYRVYSHRP